MSISPHESDLAAGADAAVRPFRIEFPQDAIDDLRRRIKATRWPEQETVADDSQGVPLQTMQDLLRYWGTEFDWSACEARLNALPNFVTEVDGLDIHFLHIRSDHEDALPLIVTHGWPGSIIEQLKIIEPLTNPTAHGGSASDALAPGAVGSVSGPMIFSCSMIEPGHPWVTISGNAPSWSERT